MTLYTGRRIHSFKWDKLLIDNHVIQRVEALAEEEKQHLIHRGNPCFEWAPGVEIEDIFEEENESTLAIANDIHHEEAQEQNLLGFDSDE